MVTVVSSFYFQNRRCHYSAVPKKSQLSVIFAKPTMKSHPLSRATEAQVLAVRFGVEQWGFVRIFRGSALGIWDKWATGPIAVPVKLEETPEKWFCHYLSPKVEETEVIEIGVLPFASDEQSWAPPCFYAPDIFQNHYRIYNRGMFRVASAEEVVGINPCERMAPAQLAERFRKLFTDGLLNQISNSPVVEPG